MSFTKSQVNSEFEQLAITDTEGNILGLSLNQLEIANVANLTIPGGSNGQVIITDGQGNLTWGAPGTGTVLAENGTVVSTVVDGSAISTSAATPTRVLTFNIPSSGTWEITASLSVGTLQPTSSYGALYTGSTPSPATLVAGTIQGVAGISGGAGVQVGTTLVWTVTTTGASTYSVGMYGTGVVVIYTAAGGGFTRGSWKKISGYVPVTGTTVSWGYYRVVAPLPTGTGGIWNLSLLDGNMPVVSSNTVLLKAEVTYELRASVAARSAQSTNDGFTSFNWRTTGGTALGQQGVVYPNNSTDTGVAEVAYAVYTPPVDTFVQLFINNSRTIYQTDTTYGEISIKQLGTSSVSQFSGTLTNGWSINNSYPAGTIVVVNGMTYQSNDMIPAGTAFSVGTTGATWSQIGFGQVTAEFGETVMPTPSVDVNVSAGSPVTILSFTLPSAGTWEIDYIGKAYTNISAGAVIAIYNSAGVLVPNSEVQINYTGTGITNGLQNTGTGVIRVTTTGSEVYTLRAWRDGPSGTVRVFTDGNGRTSVKWKKISGFLPALGAATSYRTATLNTSLVGNTTVQQDITAVTLSVGNLPLSNTGVWSLQAGVTYELFVVLNYDAGASNQFTGDTYVTFVDAITNTILPNQHGAGIITPFFTGRGLYRNGETRFAYTPSTNQNIKLRVMYQNSAGTLEAQTYVAQIGTTNSTAFTGSLTNGWSINNTYAQGTIVVKDGALYQANSTISAGTAWTVGAVDGTWAPIGTGQVAAEYGSQVLGGAVALTNNITVDVMSFTIPSAGTWEIEYTARGKLTSATTYISPMITDNNNVMQDNSMTIINYLAPGTYIDFQGSASSVARVTTTGPAVYKLRAFCSSSTAATILSDLSAGQTKVSWKKIGGFLPATGSATSYTNALGLLTQPSVGATGLVRASTVTGNIPYNSTTGVWTLTAGVTYQLWATWQTTAAQEINLAWVDATTNLAPPNILNGYTIGNATGPQTSGIYTPQTNQQLKLWVIFTVGGQISSRLQASIVQLGTTNVSGFLGTINNGWSINNSYPAGTIVVRDGLLYQANTTIIAGTPWAVGTTGATWAGIGVQQAEYGEVPLLASVTVPASNVTPQTVDVMSFTLPTAGVWEVTYNARCGVSSNGSFVAMSLTDGSNNIVPQSTELASFITIASGTVAYQGVSSMVVRITTSGLAQYKLRARASGDTLQSTVFGFNDGNGGTKVTWKKISGFTSVQTRTLTAPLQIGATTTAPTKASASQVDYLSLVDDGSGWCDVSFEYSAALATGAANGSGGYLYRLPDGYSFDPAYHLYDTDTTGITSPRLNRIIPGSSGFVGITGSTSSAVIIPYDATRFKVVTIFQTGGTGNSAWTMTGSGYYAIAFVGYAILGSFRFKKM